LSTIQSPSGRSSLAEREGVGFYAPIEKLNLKLAVDDRLGLPNQLTQPLIENRAVAALVDVNATRRTGSPGSRET
jgi:hypothetical protein